jgi:hypothetical protein
MIHRLRVNGASGRKAIALKNEGAEMQFPSVLDLRLSGLQEIECDLAWFIDAGIPGDPRMGGFLGARVDLKMGEESSQG